MSESVQLWTCWNISIILVSYRNECNSLQYIRATFFSGIIIVTIFCGVLCMCRYRADIYFDLARKAVPAYALGFENSAYVQWAYGEAVRCNPCQSDNYKGILDGTFYGIVRENVKRKEKG